MSASSSTSAFPPFPTDTTTPHPSSVASSLYLLTFAATLVLLLVVFSAIIVRSLVVRRRLTGSWRTTAVRNGAGGKANGIGDKPKVYDVTLGTLSLDEVHNGENKEKEKMREPHFNWSEFLPVSASYLEPPVSSIRPNTSSAPTFPPTLNPHHMHYFLTQVQHVFPLISPRKPPVSLAPVTAFTPRTIRLAVLIAMPSQNPLPFIHAHTHTHESYDAEELPCVELGVADLSINVVDKVEEC